MVVAARAGDTFDTKTASFAVTFHDETSAYRDTAVVVMPGEAVIFNTVGGPPGDYAAATDDGTLVQQGAAPVAVDRAGSSRHVPDHVRRPREERRDRRPRVRHGAGDGGEERAC